MPHVTVGAPCQPFFLVPFTAAAAVCTADQRENYIASPSLALALAENYNNSLATRPIHANSKQCSSSARRMCLLYSRRRARTLTTDDWAVRALHMHVDVHLYLSFSVGTPFSRHDDKHYTRSQVPMKLYEHSDVHMKHQYEHSAVPMKLPKALGWLCYLLTWYMIKHRTAGLSRRSSEQSLFGDMLHSCRASQWTPLIRDSSP